MIESMALKLSEAGIEKSPLAEIAKSVENKNMNVSELDKPIAKEIGLSNEEKNILKENGMSDSLIENAIKDKNGIIQLKTLNSSLEGIKHDTTLVDYNKKSIEVGGLKVEGVFPEFESVFDTRLSKENYNATDKNQFKECNSKLKETVQNDKILRENFNEQQLEMIENGETPRGYTWHHNERIGEMQLVKTDVHNKTAHTGGKAIWGGGQENR
jgi:hypothetical protein